MAASHRWRMKEIYRNNEKLLTVDDEKPCIMVAWRRMSNNRRGVAAIGVDASRRRKSTRREKQ